MLANLGGLRRRVVQAGVESVRVRKPHCGYESPTDAGSVGYLSVLGEAELSSQSVMAF